MNRRHFLTSISACIFTPPLLGAASSVHIATNVYPWMTFYNREKRDWNKDLNQSIAEVTKTGLVGLEPIAGSAQGIQDLGTILTQQNLQMRSLYVNSKLHDAKSAPESIKQVVAIAEAAKKLGCRIVVTNPEPIRWGGPDNKSDDQLKIQGEQLNRLGQELKKLDVILAYHNHDMEMRQSAREFHHMMNGTDPTQVLLCLDAHWIYRGSGNSQVALFDIVKLYSSRIIELHLRQSKDGIWTEVFGEGDIDYTRLAKVLLDQKLKPHLVLEQAVEAKSPNTMNAIEAHKQSLKQAQEIFRAFA